MKIYVFLILIICFTSCLGKSHIKERSDNEMIRFYNVYKLRKMYDMTKDEDTSIIRETEDKCIINYLSKEIKTKKTDYQGYLLNLPVNKTNKYNKLIIDLTIKSAGPFFKNK